MFIKIFHRPALAIVISVLILFLGGLAINTLPISQFPSVAPPSVVVSVSYPGASAEVRTPSRGLLALADAHGRVQGQPPTVYTPSLGVPALTIRHHQKGKPKRWTARAP